jgi:signal transduction histidine kinase
MIAGGILAYLSINNISNFKELTEKRILEEEKDIHSYYAGNFGEALDRLSRKLKEHMGNREFPPVNTQKNVLYPEVSDYLIIMKDGAMIRPHFSVQDLAPAQNRRSLFANWYERGEHQEFQDEDLGSALFAYNKALENADTPCDSAKTYNALVRLHNKWNQNEEALGAYKVLIDEYGLCTNRFGIPYVYFSIDPLLRDNSHIQVSERTMLLTAFLDNLVGNRIAYTHTTEVLLDSLIQDATLGSDPDLSNLIRDARKKAQLIRKYRPVLLEIQENPASFESYKQNDFIMVPPGSETKDLFMVYERKEILYGFVLPFEQLDQQAREMLDRGAHKFQYELISEKRSPEPGKLQSNLEIENPINLNFPEEVLRIRPVNKDEISDFIFRRKLITYLGLSLLVAAMVIGLYMMFQNVNRKKRMARLRTDFVANVTHELKTPLTSINMFADSILLRRYKSEEGLSKYARIILKESEKLKRMVNNILEFSRQENNQINYELMEENIAGIIHEVLEEMDYWLSAHHFKVNLDLEDDLYAIVDSEGLKQAMSNLITNAIKYSPEEKRIIIRSYSKGSYACIDVQDYGMGIPSDQLESIFEKFYRISDHPTAQASGTGLGLTVSREIIASMKGRLTVESSIGKGSCFTITLNSSKS